MVHKLLLIHIFEASWFLRCVRLIGACMYLITRKRNFQLLSIRFTYFAYDADEYKRKKSGKKTHGTSATSFCRFEVIQFFSAVVFLQSNDRKEKELSFIEGVALASGLRSKLFIN